MIVDYLCFKNILLLLLIKMFLINFYNDNKFRNQTYALSISLLIILFAWYVLWLYVLQRFKMIKDFVNEINF